LLGRRRVKARGAGNSSSLSVIIDTRNFSFTQDFGNSALYESTLNINYAFCNILKISSYYLLKPIKSFVFNGKSYQYSLATPRRSLFLSMSDVSNYRNALGMPGDGEGGDAVAQFMEVLVEIAGSIPDGVTGIFTDIILPAALWP